MQAILLTPLPLSLVSMPLPCLDFAPKSIFGFRSHLVVVQKHFPLLTSIMLSIYFIALWMAENAVQVTKTLNNITNQSLSTSTAHLHIKKAGMKAVVKSKHPFLCQASQGLLRLRSYPQGLDYG
jgi:hypothetical protein